jgi:hypothetical protein
MKAVLILIAGLVSLVAVAFVSANVGGSKMAMQVQATCSEAQKAYLMKRFELAYAQEPPAVAIWEGTNMLAYLAQDGIAAQSRSKEEKASLLFLNARVSELFRELGDTTSTREFAVKAMEWYRLISTNKAVNAETVVAETLARDHVKRRLK